MAIRAEGEGFEPSVRFDTYGALAKPWFQPLTHPSGEHGAGMNREPWRFWQTTPFVPPPASRPPVEPAPVLPSGPVPDTSSPPLRTRVAAMGVAVVLVGAVVGGAAVGQAAAGLGVALAVAAAWALAQGFARRHREGAWGVPHALARPSGGWLRMLGRGVVWGIGLQILSTIVVEPLLTALTGEAADLGAFASLDGDAGALASMLLVTWGLVVWIEEGLFRAVLIPALATALGARVVSRTPAVWIAVVLAAAGFSLAHVYQGATGVGATGVAGAVLGVLFVREGGRLWAGAVAHGVANTLALVALYLGWG